MKLSDRVTVLKGIGEKKAKLLESSGIFTLQDILLRFPRKYECVYHDIMARHERTVVDGYEIKITGDEIFVTERVNNVLFVKRV